MNIFSAPVCNGDILLIVFIENLFNKLLADKFIIVLLKTLWGEIRSSYQVRDAYGTVAFSDCQ